jgi:hypothetical protein
MFIRKALLMVPVAAIALACGGGTPEAAAPEAPAEGAAKAGADKAAEGADKADEAKPAEGGDKADEAKPAEGDKKPAE